MPAKGFSASKGFIVGSAVTLAIATFTACGVEYEFGADVPAYPCLDRTYNDYHSILCREARCAGDAGIPEDNCGDAGTSSSGSSLRCVGKCVPNEPDGFADPQPVYIGQGKAKYALGCPEAIGGVGGTQYSGLNIPSPGCPACLCGPIEGSCAPPTTIALRGGTCDAQAVDSFDFSGPTPWDGSCTNVNAMPAGTECPANSGNSCAQSLDAATLAPPIETCAPISWPVPKATSDTPWWTNIVHSCSPSILAGTCDNPASETCLPAIPRDEPEWRYCVRRQGVHECPTKIPGAIFVEQFVAYDGFIDTRKCTECSCEGSGGNCFGTLRVYPDDTCSTNEIVSNAVFSDMNNCTNLTPSGDSFGSKEFTDMIYIPGKCEAKGGEPIGDVVPITTKLEPDGKVQETATTWCCMGPSAPDAGADAAFQ